MRHPRFFHPDLHAGSLTLSPEESHHALVVLRVDLGLAVEIFDGAGKTAWGRISSLRRRGVEVLVERIELASREPEPRLVLAVCPPKGDRQQVLVEKCTELGVGAFTLLTAARSVVQPSPGSQARWRRWVIESCKQCGRVFLPEVYPPATYMEFLSSLPGSARIGLGQAGSGSRPLVEWAREAKGDSLILLIGPEGGWTTEEMEAASSRAVEPILLSSSTLRVETAAIAAAAVIEGMRVERARSLP